MDDARGAATDGDQIDGSGRSGPAAVAEDEYVELNDEEWADADLPNTFPSGDTLEQDRRGAASDHGAGEVDDEAAAHAPEGPVPRSVAEAERRALEVGAQVQGEGAIVPEAPGS